jgi:ribonuclease HI
MSQNKKKYYTVVKGRVPGIYSRWFGPGGAEEQIRGYTGAVYRGFATIEEAQDFMARPVLSIKRKPGSQSLDKCDDNPLETERPIHIYTDGGCLDNPGPGGYGAVIKEGNSRIELSGGYRLTTNNRMEIMACLKALGTLKIKSRVVLFTDSQYVANAVEKGWAIKWRSKNWMRDRNNKALNSDLWSELLKILEKHDVVFRWVRGHAGNPENERCDVLAKKAAQGKDLEPDCGYEKAMAELKESTLF